MLKSIRTKKLYYRYDYQFDFSKNKMTIISGPNGFGKTTILKIIRDVLDDDLYNLSKIPFEEVELTSDNNKKIIFKKENGNLFINNKIIYVPEFINKIPNGDVVFGLSQNDLIDIRRRYDKNVPTQQRLVVSTLYADDGDTNTKDDLLRVNSQIHKETTKAILNELLDFYTSVGNTIFCGADRLYHEYGINDGTTKDELTNVVEGLSKKLNDIINNYYNRYTQLSNELDFRFISILNKEIADQNIYTIEDYESDKKTTKSQIEKLERNMILVKEVFYNKNLKFNETYSLAFKVFYNNLKTKLNSLVELTDKIELFEKIINSKLINKSISIINGEFRNKSIVAKDGKNLIKLSDLSSGEKEIIVLFFKLIFEDSKKLIALIDEPELSTHVSWQYETLDDFEKIMSVNKALKQVIVCTHSPQIINNRWDKTIDLYDEAMKSNG